MSPDNDRVMEICKQVSQEKNPDKLTALVRELNRELGERPTKKQPGTALPESAVRRATQGC